MSREPIFWQTTVPEDNKKDRERTIMGSDGMPTLERFPQTGHIGDYENKIRAPGQRFIKVCRHDGNVVSLVMTNAAAHLDTTTSFATYQRLKCLALGWFPAAGCVARLVASNELDPDKLAAKLARDVEPCTPGSHSLEHPCEHTAREIKARQDRNAAANEKRMRAFKSDADKALEEARETNRQLREIVESALSAGGKGKRARGDTGE